jgi:dolichyl-phosphate-mannose-protein mannosyltransferase
MKPDESIDRSRQEWLAIAVVTLIGACLRFWPIGRLGLTHFDEGIYALVASSMFAPSDLIPYAPPGYPILGWLAGWFLGPSDSSMIFVSQVAGILTIPVVGWLGRRTFGPGAGFASSIFCACSGPQIAFSRMALTDASSLLVWLLALGAGMRFLERPGFLRALVMGLVVGLAQEFKYNGWLTGAFVVGSALIGMMLRSEDRKLGSIAKIFGWGGFAAVVAWLVVWPWFAFVEANGGYSALLRHQRSYLGGFGAWWPNFLTQADQAVALSGGNRLILPSLLLACLTIAIARPRAWLVETAGDSRFRRVFFIVGFGFAPWLLISAPYWLGLVLAPWLLTRPNPSVRIVGIWWLGLTILTPFYHAYARLWLPYEAVNWLLMGWLVPNGLAMIREIRPLPTASNRELVRTRLIGLGFLGLFGVGGLVWFKTDVERKARPQTDLLAPSDSLRQACNQVALLLSDEVKGLQLLVRPPALYYLAGRVRVSRMGGSDQLRMPGYPGTWALVDSAILRSELGRGSEESSRNLLDRLANHWEVVQEIPTMLALPTLLDLDPEAARSTSSDRTCRLWLLRPRRPGAPR